MWDFILSAVSIACLMQWSYVLWSLFADDKHHMIDLSLQFYDAVLLSFDVAMTSCLADLLCVEKCSSGKARERTCCSINRVVMGSVS